MAGGEHAPDGAPTGHVGPRPSGGAVGQPRAAVGTGPVGGVKHIRHGEGGQPRAAAGHLRLGLLDVDDFRRGAARCSAAPTLWSFYGWSHD